MTPSRILKRAWTRCGKPMSLKRFARNLTNNPTVHGGVVRSVADAWWRNKRKATP